MSSSTPPGNTGKPTPTLVDAAPKADFSNVKSGFSSTEAEVEKADFSNVQSAVTSTEEIVGEQSYTVQKGDTLSHIAQTYYGKASGWKKIFEANRDQLDDPDRIKPGQVLRVPIDPDAAPIAPPSAPSA